MIGGDAEGIGRGTCFPMMPIQAIDGVVMVGNGGQQSKWFGGRC